MTAKEYLQQVAALSERIRQIEAEIQKLREEQILLRSPWPDGQPHGTGKSDPVGNQATKIADQIRELETKQLKKRGELWIKRSEIIETIGRIGDEKLNRLLWMRYVEDDSFEKIAVEMHYTYRHVVRLHGDALVRVDRILEQTCP